MIPIAVSPIMIDKTVIAIVVKASQNTSIFLQPYTSFLRNPLIFSIFTLPSVLEYLVEFDIHHQTCINKLRSSLHSNMFRYVQYQRSNLRKKLELKAYYLSVRCNCCEILSQTPFASSTASGESKCSIR